jgi:hypothetical protein
MELQRRFRYCIFAQLRDKKWFRLWYRSLKLLGDEVIYSAGRSQDGIALKEEFPKQSLSIDSVLPSVSDNVLMLTLT